MALKLMMFRPAKTFENSQDPDWIPFLVDQVSSNGLRGISMVPGGRSKQRTRVTIGTDVGQARELLPGERLEIPSPAPWEPKPEAAA